MLLDISEPGNENNSPKNDEIIIGIDFGTTNSISAAVIDGEMKILSGIVSSIVQLKVENELFEIKSIKRIFGKNFDDLKNATYISESIKNMIESNDGKIFLNIKNNNYHPIEIASKIFMQLKEQSEKILDKKVKKAVVTVPAYFDDAAKTMVKDSAKLANIEVVRLIAEPTAAAYAYGLDNDSEGNYLVYDLGGGTFDVSILKMTKGVFQVLAIGGDSELGGDDVDYAIMKYLLMKNNFNFLVEFEKDLLTLTRKIKEELSTKNSANFEFNGTNFELTTDDLENIASPFIQKTINICKKTIRDSGLEFCLNSSKVSVTSNDRTNNIIDNEIKGIILVGGSTRMPLVKKMIQNQLSDIIYDNFNPDIVVAIGAARQGENLSKNSNDLIIDVNPLSLGIELLGGFNERIIERNSAIPTSVTKYYTTSADNQNSMDFHVIQGDREFAKDCRSLCSFTLKSIPLMAAGIPRIAVNFTIDPDGLLFITAYEEISGQKQEISVKPSYGLSDEEVISMLKNAMENAESDYAQRLKLEATTKAEEYLKKFYSYLKKYDYLIEENEKKILENYCKIIENMIHFGEYDKIDACIADLQERASSFIENIVNKELSDFLGGKKLSDFSK